MRLELRRHVGPRTACNSTLYGDVRFRSCGPFCKEAKRSNHCHFCKCADCSFCTSPALDAHASVSSTFAPTPTISAAELDGLLRPFESRSSVCAVTSVFLPQLAKAAPSYTNTLFGRPLQLPLRAYYDGTGEPPRLDHVHWVSLESAAPWAAQFVKRHREENSTIQREYARRRYTCIAGRVSEKGRMTHLHGGVCRDFYTAYKTAALTDAVARGVASYVLWLDYDTWFQRPLDLAFWRWMSMFDVATIGQKPPRNPETGIVMMHTGRARRFAERLRDGYEDPAARLAAGGVNDVQIFGSLLTRMQGEVHAGFFAVGCRSRSSTDQWVVESRPYKQTAHHYCAHEAPNVSPWNIFEYITHLKTGTGPIALSKRQKERFNAGLAVG